MKERIIKLIISSLVVAVIASVVTGCQDESTNNIESITVSGSSALLPLMEKSIEKFNEKNPYAEISAQAGGSGTGLTQVLDGTVDIGNSDVFAAEILDAAKAKELVDHKVVAQGFVVVVSTSLGIDN